MEDKKCIILYGQLRTFKKCIPILLKYLNYDKNKYNVYLFIDKNNDVNYTEENLQLLHKMFDNNISEIFYTDDFCNFEFENNKFEYYKKKCDEIKNYFDNGNAIVTNDFVIKLYTRRLQVLNIMNDYIKNNNLLYSFVIFSRFDINLTNYLQHETFDENKLYIAYDILFMGKFEKILELYNFSNNYFSIYNYLKNQGETNLIKFLNEMNMCDIKSNNNFIRFCNMWICMPEANFKFYVKVNKIEYVELYYYGCLQR